MANPNVVGVQTVRGKSTVRAFVKNVRKNFLVNNANSGEILKVNSLYVANKHTISVNVTIQMTGPSTQNVSQNVVDSIVVPANSSIVLISKNTDLYLNENTALSIFATSNDKISLVCSYEQISDGTPIDRNDIDASDVQDPIAADSQTIYTTPGTYNWIAPTGITSVSVVCVGAGGAGDDGNSGDGGGGGGAGGGLVYANDIPVTPGTTYTVVVGAGGSNGNGKNARAQNGGNTSFTVGTFVMTAIGGEGGAPYGTNPGATGRSYAVSNTPSGVTVGGGTGGNGGGGYNGGGGGGGAAGYNGNGGTGSYSLTNSPAAAGAGLGSGGGGGPTTGGAGNSGGANGGNGQYDVTGGGGGGATIFSDSNLPTVGGNGNGSTSSGSKGGDGGWPGGGGGGSWDNNTGVVAPGGHGAVKIIWGAGRSFPNTATNLYTLEYLVVGGGGGGGVAHAGGGGAGGYVSSVLGELSGTNIPANPSFPFPYGQTLTVTVGAGGARSGSRTVNATNGSNSVFGTITALGGGGGGSEYKVGNSLGTGGGNATNGEPVAQGTYGQGFEGGINVGGVGFGGGGGGGASQAGGALTVISGSTKQGGKGGDGLYSSITGSSVARGGGGGGGGINLDVCCGVTYGGEPGVGGGGRGGGYTNETPADGAGTTNTGGGGGGGGYPQEFGSNGGSGVVIIAYPDNLPALTSVSAGLTYDTPTRTGYRVYRFTAGTGTITFGT